MGYESRLYVVSENDIGNDVWAEEIVTLDMCCCPGLREVFTEEARGYILGNDEEVTHIRKDAYDSPIMSADLEDVEQFLRGIYRKEHYWRAKVGADLMKSLRETKYKTRDCFKVYHYGY